MVLSIEKLARDLIVLFIIVIAESALAESVEAVAALAAVLWRDGGGDDVAVLVQEGLLAEDVDGVVVVAEEVAVEGVDPLRRRLPKVVR